MRGGIVIPTLVPVDDRGMVNEKELRRYVEWLVNKGVSGIFANGSTGEFVCFSRQERWDIVRITTDQVAGRIPVLAGASDTNPHDVWDSLDYYATLGCAAVSLAPPAYFKLGPQSVKGFFEQAAQRSTIPLFLYHIPQFTTGIDRDLLTELARNDRVVGVKDSSRDFAGFCGAMARIRATRPDFAFFTGTEEIIVPSLFMGAQGAIVATGGIVPEVTRALHRACLDGAWERARALQARLLPLIAELLSVDFPLGFRVALSLRGFTPGQGRMAYATHTDSLKALARRLEPMIQNILTEVDHED